MPVQQTSPSDLIRQTRLKAETNIVHNAKAGNIKSGYAIAASPIKLTAINSSKFAQTPTQKNFTTGLKLSPITHMKF